MTLDTLFLIANVAVMPFWLLMIACPTWTITKRIIASSWVIIFMPILYLILIVPQLPNLMPLLTSPPQLDTIARLLGTREGASVGWVHYLAFDLFVGRWIYLQSRQERRSPWIMAPILFLTLMMGPIGLLMFVILQRLFPRPAE